VNLIENLMQRAVLTLGDVANFYLSWSYAIYLKNFQIPHVWPFECLQINNLWNRKYYLAIYLCW